MKGADCAFERSTVRSAARLAAHKGVLARSICDPARLHGTLRRNDTQIIYTNQQPNIEPKAGSDDMANSDPRKRPRSAAPKGNISPAEGAPTEDTFPPLTISLETFVKNGSDREFRQLIFELMGLSNQMKRHSDQFARYIGRNNAQFHLMIIMAEMPDLTVSQIAQLMNVTSQFVTIEIGQLIRDDIVSKRLDESDRRSSFLNLTSKGKNLIRELAPLLRRANNLHFRSLNEERAKILTETIHTLIVDGARVLHELESPDVRNAKAPSAQSQPETRSGRSRPPRRQVRRSR
jgi:MarR family transcriptional regulator, organic hydroperoxide resistance regulator